MTARCHRPILRRHAMRAAPIDLAISLGFALAIASCAGTEEEAPVETVCRCEDGAVGTIACTTVGDRTSCRCATGEVSCPGFATEDCDGIDNDRNGKIDDGEVCPDASVAGATPFTGGVYLLGTTRESQCGNDALQRFWPTQAMSYFSGFSCDARWYKFRRSDSAIYYQATFSGIHLDGETADPLQPTPPCDDQVEDIFDFDAAGTLYYRCRDIVLKARGTAVADRVASLAATLDDGRVLITRFGTDGEEFVVVDGSGNELSRLPPPREFAGDLFAVPRATTVAGNHAYVAFNRRYPVNRREIVVFHLDDRSQWSRVRRVAVPDFGVELVLSDGTVLIRGHDPAVPPGLDEQIVAFLPDGTSRTAWREAEQTVVRSHGHQEMLIGPP
jgi:hypothetical protein